MSYYKKVLQLGETVLYIGHLHWIIYLPAKVAFLIDATSFAFYFYSRNDLVLIFGWLLAPIWLLMVFSAWIRQISTEIVVTDKRVIHKRGFFRRITSEMNMNKIESVDVIQGILGRVLGYGEVALKGAGATFDPMSPVATPISFRNAIRVE